MHVTKLNDQPVKGTSTGCKLLLILAVLGTLFVFTGLVFRHFAVTMKNAENSLSKKSTSSFASLYSDKQQTPQGTKFGRDTKRKRTRSKNSKQTNTNETSFSLDSSSAAFSQLISDLKEEGKSFKKTSLEADQADQEIYLQVPQFAKLKGIHSRAYGKSVFKFLGVPYAQPPLEKLRFSEPLPYNAKPDEIIDARQFKSICPQFFDEILVKTVSPRTLNMSEDCLTINIWTPSLPSKNWKQVHVSEALKKNHGHDWTLLSEKTLDFDDDKLSNNSRSESLRAKRATVKEELLPVMFWIHGGGFSMGSAALDEYDGQMLASYGKVIVVTVNYRVGVFGFFNLETPSATGNQGLKDQLMALKWVHEHIQVFGGDPERVTLFGQSAGAFAVGLHMLHPDAGRKLFKRAILQSGSPLVFDQFYANTVKIANALVKQVSCNLPGDEDLDESSDDHLEEEDEGDSTEDSTNGYSTESSKNLTDTAIVETIRESFRHTHFHHNVSSSIMNITNAGSMNIVKANLMNIPENASNSGFFEMNKNNSRAETVIKCMKKRTMKQLIRAQKAAMQKSTFPFSPNREASLLPRMPAELLKQDQLRDWLAEDVQQVLLGVNRDEGSLYLHLGMPDLFPADELKVNLTKLSELRSMLAANLTSGFKVPHAQAQLVAGLLLSNGPEIDTRENLVRKYHQLLADLMFNCPSILLADELAKGRQGGKARTVYFYRFNERPTVTNWGEWMGVTHHEEVQFIFGLPLRYPLRYAIKDQVMSKRIIRTWTHFARTGEMLPQLGVHWPAYDEKQQLMELSAFEAKLSEKLHEKNCNLFRIGFETFMRRRRKRFIRESQKIISRLHK